VLFRFGRDQVWRLCRRLGDILVITGGEAARLVEAWPEKHSFSANRAAEPQDSILYPLISVFTPIVAFS
jgi:hypothetical protein